MKVYVVGEQAVSDDFRSKNPDIEIGIQKLNTVFNETVEDTLLLLEEIEREAKELGVEAVIFQEVTPSLAAALMNFRQKGDLRWGFIVTNAITRETSVGEFMFQEDLYDMLGTGAPEAIKAIQFANPNAKISVEHTTYTDTLRVEIERDVVQTFSHIQWLVVPKKHWARFDDTLIIANALRKALKDPNFELMKLEESILTGLEKGELRIVSKSQLQAGLTTEEQSILGLARDAMQWTDMRADGANMIQEGLKAILNRTAGQPSANELIEIIRALAKINSGLDPAMYMTREKRDLFYKILEDKA